MAEQDSNHQVELAERIHRWRRTRGWTQADLAERAGFARSTLSKIENAQLSPTYEILVKLAQGFDVSVSELMADEGTSGLSGRLSVDDGTMDGALSYANHRLHPLAGQLKGRKFDSFVVEFTCRDLDSFGEWNQHETEDMLFVLEGELEFHSEGYEPYLLSAGQSIQFDGRMRHACLSKGTGVCKCLYVCAR